MDCLASCGKTLIILINTLFGLIALACLAIGLIIKFGKEILGDVLDKLVAQIGDQLTPILDATDKQNFLDNLDLTDLFGDVAIVLIVFGAVLLGLVLIGYCGACCKLRFLLILYSLVLIIILLTQITGMILIFAKRDVVDTEMQKPLIKSLHSQYKGDQGMDAVSLAWNAVMLQMSCCGVKNYEDFKDSSGWDRTFTVKGGGHKSSGLQTPIVCCNEKGRNAIVTDATCAKNPLNEDISNYQYGCYDAIWDEIEKFKPTVIGVVCGIGVFQLLLIFFSIWLAHSIKKENEVSPI